MMIEHSTIVKSDLYHVVQQLVCPAHYAFIFGELLEAYPQDTELTLTSMLEPFSRKVFKERAPGMWYREVRYSDYICPLFYASSVCRGEQSPNVIKEVVGIILKECGHFYVPPEVNVWDPDVDRNDHRQLYWGTVDLSEEEATRVELLVRMYRKIRLQTISEI